jgi:Initiator Replication protein
MYLLTILMRRFHRVKPPRPSSSINLFIQEAPLPVWANFRQRALDVAIAEINKKTDLNIEIESLERAKHRRVIGLKIAIEEQAMPLPIETEGPFSRGPGQRQ